MKLIILGLDGLSWHVLDEFIDTLPNLSRLKETGAKADLETVSPPVTAPAWVSFQTGQDIGNHGFTSFEDYDEKFNPLIRDGRTLNSITFYEIFIKLAINSWYSICRIPIPRLLRGTSYTAGWFTKPTPAIWSSPRPYMMNSDH